MKKNLDFEDTKTKKLLLKFDFQFFLNENMGEQNYSQANLQKTYNAYSKKLKQIEDKSTENTEQNFLFAEGQVRKMFTGGLLPALFQLDESREHVLFDFDEIGNNWAYFDFWKKHYQKKIIQEQIWDIITRTGSILAIALSIIKLIETARGHFG